MGLGLFYCATSDTGEALRHRRPRRPSTTPSWRKAPEEACYSCPVSPISHTSHGRVGLGRRFRHPGPWPCVAPEPVALRPLRPAWWLLPALLPEGLEWALSFDGDRGWWHAVAAIATWLRGPPVGGSMRLWWAARGCPRVSLFCHKGSVGLLLSSRLCRSRESLASLPRLGGEVRLE